MGAAIELLIGAPEWVRNPTAVEELITYLEKRRPYIPDYGSGTSRFMDREHTGGEVQRLGGLGPVQTQGMSWSPERSAGLGRAGSRATRRGTRRFATGSCMPGASVAALIRKVA